ncbi:MAG TPA: hypothetical protein PKZ35_15135 [Gammaproteobacteria bacterium]|nr:hypothetical protein [Gammaproteobacteria bacterium]
MDFDRLDKIVADVKAGDTEQVGVLSTGEYLYVALAASSCELLGDDSIAYALSRIGPEAVAELIQRHQYA